MKTCAEVAAWCAGAAEEFGDPSAPVCQIFLRWQDEPEAYRGDELVCGMNHGDLALLLGEGFPPFQFPVVAGRPQLDERGYVMAYGASCVTAGVWAITPSLNALGLIHGFVVLHGVPDPAPWERRIVLP